MESIGVLWVLIIYVVDKLKHGVYAQGINPLSIKNYKTLKYHLGAFKNPHLIVICFHILNS